MKKMTDAELLKIIEGAWEEYKGDVTILGRQSVR